MRTFLFAALLLSLLACNKEEKDPCSLDKINNRSYSGTIGLCQNQTGLFVEFDGTATITFADSIFTIHLYSQDSLIGFDQNIIATSECQTFEDDASWNFTDITTHVDVGSAYGNGKFILLNLQTPSCSEEPYFLGAIRN